MTTDEDTLDLFPPEPAAPPEVFPLTREAVDRIEADLRGRRWQYHELEILGLVATIRDYEKRIQRIGDAVKEADNRAEAEISRYLDKVIAAEKQ